MLRFGEEGVPESALFLYFCGQLEGGEVDFPELEVVLQLDVGLAAWIVELLAHLPQLPPVFAFTNCLPAGQLFRVLVEQQLSRGCFHRRS